MKRSNRCQHWIERLSRYSSSFCCQSSRLDRTKFERIEKFCHQQGILWNRSTIKMIRTSLATMIASAFDHRIEPEISKKKSDIQFQLTHVNALPSRTERGIFLIIELGNLIEDIRYSLVLLLGKHDPSYKILHSRGYDLPKSIRKSYGKQLIDQLTRGLKEFLEQIPYNDQYPRSLQVGLILHFPLKQNELNQAEILSWSDRFFCPDLLELDIIALIQHSIEQSISIPQMIIVACIQDSVAALISVAFDYPNTFIGLIFQDHLRLSFVEDIELLRSKNLLNQTPLRALYRTILSFNLHSSPSNYSMKSHALFQTLLTSIDVKVMQELNANYFDIFISDNCLLEIIRLFIVELCIHEDLLPDEIWSQSQLNRTGSIDLLFVSYLLRGKYSKLKSYLKRLGLSRIKKFDLILIEYLCHIIIRRSAQMLSCLIVGLADRYNEENLTIAIDSYLYRLCPIYSSYLRDEIEYLCKQWIRTFHFVLATDKSYLGAAAVMGLQKTQKALINQDDNVSRSYLRQDHQQRSKLH